MMITDDDDDDVPTFDVISYKSIARGGQNNARTPPVAP